MQIPNEIHSGFWKEGHVQGIAVDQEKGYIYFSFTTILLKTDFSGNPVGSVKNLAGHLGCITFDADRRRVCGSLELKHDSIGKGIINRTGWDPSTEDNFYLVSFDADRIDRMEMDAEGDGVMLAMWLGEVVADYKSADPVSGREHRLGCSGIDGTGYGPVFGAAADSPKKLMVSYGIYSQTDREDNDYQVIRQYDPAMIDRYGQPLNQAEPHHSGPETCEQTYYFYTGNTNWGIQNLEYEPTSRTWLVAVYRGKKKAFTDFPLFFIDGAKAPVLQPLQGRAGEEGLVVSQADLGETGNFGIRGSWFPLGSTGMCALGDGRVCFSEPLDHPEEKSFASLVRPFTLDPNSPSVF